VILIVGCRPGFLSDFNETWPKCVWRSNLILRYVWTLGGNHGRSFMWQILKIPGLILVFGLRKLGFWLISMFNNPGWCKIVLWLLRYQICCHWQRCSEMAGFSVFWFWASFQHVNLVKIEHIWIKYNSLRYCSCNGMLHVAIGDADRKWRIF